MAKVYGGYMGTVIGKLGTSVGYLWKGRHVFRAYVPHINYPNTELQQAERDWFISMVRFAATARQALLLGLRDRAAREQMTEGNWFVKSNKQHFHHTDDGIRVDYSRLSLSEGSVAPATATAAVVDMDGILTCNFDKNSALHRSKASDNVYLYIYNADLKRGLLAHPTRRSTAHISCLLPDGWQQQQLHCYLFAVDAQGHSSPTSYISPLTMDNATMLSDKNRKHIEVVAAIIVDNGRVLATQRGKGEWRGWWEFPGGKIEPGETPETALLREIREELAVDIGIERFVETVEWDYPMFHLTMHCYLCHLEDEQPTLTEHMAARWLKSEELSSVQWLPADQDLVSRLEIM